MYDAGFDQSVGRHLGSLKITTDLIHHFYDMNSLRTCLEKREKAVLSLFFVREHPRISEFYGSTVEFEFETKVLINMFLECSGTGSMFIQAVSNDLTPK